MWDCGLEEQYSTMLKLQHKHDSQVSIRFTILMLSIPSHWKGIRGLEPAQTYWSFPSLLY